MDTNTTISIVSIVVTVVISFITFALTQKKSTSARLERERNAKRELVSTIGRLVAEGHLKIDSRMAEVLIQSKAREYDINPSELFDLPTILEDVAARVVEDEFIPGEIKVKLYEKVLGLRDEVTGIKKLPEAALAAEIAAVRKRLSIRLSAVSSLASVGATVGVIAALLASLDYSIFIPVLASACFGIVVIILAGFYSRSKEMSEKEVHEVASKPYSALVFEELVYSALISFFPRDSVQREVTVSEGNQLLRPDFLVQIDGERLPVEAKYGHVTTQAISMLQLLKIQLRSQRAILVTSSETQENVKKLCKENSIILIDRVQTIEDIVSKLQPLASLK